MGLTTFTPTTISCACVGAGSDNEIVAAKIAKRSHYPNLQHTGHNLPHPAARAEDIVAPYPDQLLASLPALDLAS
jgi:hypothetical protein